MKKLIEIGLEKEMFLLKNGKVIEPKLYGFPYDEMGFLVEIRSYPSDSFYLILSSVRDAEILFKLRANKLGMELVDVPFLEVTDEFIQYISTKYRHSELPCLTQNIYGTKLSHHTGIMNHKITSGLHVHFSAREGTKVLKLPIKSIVKEMDKRFKKEIKESNRIKGEWEPKAHGFEYRSLPCNTNIYKILKESFNILRKLK